MQVKEDFLIFPQMVWKKENYNEVKYQIMYYLFLVNNKFISLLWLR